MSNAGYQQGLQFPMRDMEELPACALTCLAHAAAATNCSVTDIACACSNEAFIDHSRLCIAESCTVREIFSTQNQTAVQCHVHPYVDMRFVPITIAFFALALIVVLLRAAARVVSQARFWWDDYFNLAAFVTVSVYTFADISLVKYGFGIDIWAVPQENISYILLFFIINSCLWMTCRVLTRVSILLFYLRIFSCTPRHKVIIMWTLAAVVLFSCVIMIPMIIQCSPVNYLWLGWDGTYKGHCINFRLFVWVATPIGIAMDLWIVVIAGSFVSRVQMPLKRKIMISSMFTVGLIAIAISIARLPNINQFTETKNPTIDWVPITIWSTLENYIGVICACLPSLPTLLKPLSARKIPSGTERSHFSSNSASHRVQAAEHETQTSIYELAPTSTPTDERVIELGHENTDAISVSSAQLYHNFSYSG
ncbi:hypothetical protein F5Y14DRAFT_452648 [Nemania sp. NC0429]|nr:hypothetical protein F5Y14DRAFT_452648 [Nemania sp. NC0429]